PCPSQRPSHKVALDPIRPPKTEYSVPSQGPQSSPANAISGIAGTVVSVQSAKTSTKPTTPHRPNDATPPRSSSTCSSNANAAPTAATRSNTPPAINSLAASEPFEGERSRSVCRLKPAEVSAEGLAGRVVTVSLTEARIVRSPNTT